jgi:predicted amidohydrolase
MNLISLQLKTTNNFEENLQNLVYHIKNSPQNSLIVAPELCLTGYSYESMQNAVNITHQAIPLLEKFSSDKIIALTMTTRKDEKYYNTLFIFHKGSIVHTQSKYKLFSLGDEEKYFTSGDLKGIKIIEIAGLKIATLICFELRFTELWMKLQGADIILVPAMNQQMWLAAATQDNLELLKFISENGYQWYLENGTINSNVEILKKIININKLK